MTYPEGVPPIIPTELSNDSYDQVEARMFWDSPMYAADSSFIGELSRARAKGADAFLFTAYSAVPLADAVRSFYSTLGEELPLIGYIMARKVSRGEAHRAQLREQETPRLATFLEGCRRVCVVEQFVSTHKTLFFAHSLVSGATEGKIEEDDIRGSYYHTVNQRDIDLENTTSAHSEFMRTIGEKAALSVCRMTR